MDRNGVVLTCQELAMWLAFYRCLCLYINVRIILFVCCFFILMIWSMWRPDETGLNGYFMVTQGLNLRLPAKETVLSAYVQQIGG